MSAVRQLSVESVCPDNPAVAINSSYVRSNTVENLIIGVNLKGTQGGDSGT